jgi:hypothetical protein
MPVIAVEFARKYTTKVECIVFPVAAGSAFPCSIHLTRSAQSEHLQAAVNVARGLHTLERSTAEVGVPDVARRLKIPRSGGQSDYAICC